MKRLVYCSTIPSLSRIVSVNTATFLEPSFVMDALWSLFSLLGLLIRGLVDGANKYTLIN